MTKDQHLERVFQVLSGDTLTMQGIAQLADRRGLKIDQIRFEYGKLAAYKAITDILLCADSAEEALAQVKVLSMGLACHKKTRQGFHSLRKEALQGIEFAIEHGEDPDPID